MLQIYEVANFNLMEFASIYNNFINTEEPKDLTVQIMDKDGKIRTINIKNVAAIKQEVKGDIEAEAKARMDADTKIQDTIAETSKSLIERINTETAARENYDKVLASSIDKESDRAQKAEQGLQVTIDGVKTQLVNSVKELQDLIDKETQRAKTAETDLDNKIIAETDRAKAAESNITNQLIDESDRAKAVESKLDKKITYEIVRANDAETKLDKEIKDETARAVTSEDSLDKAIKAEIQNRINGDTSLENEIKDLKNDLSEETKERLASDGDLHFNDDIRDDQGNLADDLTKAVNIVDDRLNSEVKELKNADTSLKNYIDSKIENLINGAPQVLDTLKELADALGDNPNFAKTITEKIANTNTKIGDLGKLSTEDKDNLVDAINEVQAEVNTERQTRIAADTKLFNKIEAEIARAEKAEETIDTKVENEITRATTVENKLNSDIETEAKTRELAVADLQSDIDNEVKRAKDAETTLNNNLTEEIERAKAAEKTLTDNLNAEKTERTANETEIKKALNSEIQERKTNDENIEKELTEEIARAKAAEGTLEFNKDIKNSDGSAPTNLTDAVNDVDNKVVDIDARLVKVENLLSGNIMSNVQNAQTENDLSKQDIASLKKYIDSLF